MAFMPWECAHGDAPSVTLPVAATVPIAPSDDSVDTNIVTISGTGTISSLGPVPAVTDDNGNLVNWGTTKQVTFSPSGGNIVVVHNPPNIVLIGLANRTITSPSMSKFQTSSTGWLEISTQTVALNLEGQIATLEARVAALEARLG
jgi:hypothetical protein